LEIGHAQRFKGFNLDSFLDNKIAEEQAKQQRQSSPGSAKRTPSDTGPRRNNTRTGSPSRRAGSRLRAAEGASAPEAAGKGPDPEEFVIGDDASDISRVATPRPVKESAEGPLGDAGESAEKQDVDSPPVKKKERADDDEMPEDVRKKLARLESLTNKYQGMHVIEPVHPMRDILHLLTADAQIYSAITAQRMRACPPSNPSRLLCESTRP